MRKFVLLSGLILLFIFSFLYFYYNNSSNDFVNNKGPFFAIVPHHSITNLKLESFYKFLQNKYSGVKKIVIISPDHYNVGGGFATGVPSSNRLCFLSDCVQVKPINKFINNESIFGLFNNSSGGLLTTREHGLGVHFKYINKYFSGAIVFPMVLHREKDSFTNTDLLYKSLISDNSLFDSNTLILSSVDFSHHINDSIAKFHDQKTLDSINYGLDFSNTEVDCQNCIKLVSDLSIFYNKQFFHLFARTSVDTILGINSGFGNTSHIFGTFDSTNSKDVSDGGFKEYMHSESKIYGAFFGDTMFSGFGNSNNSMFLNNSLSNFYQSGDTSKNNNGDYHKILYGLDIVGANLETVISNSGNCNSSKDKTLTFVSNSFILQELKNIGFNTLSLSNNHINDCGNNGVVETKKFLNSFGFDFFGDNNILKKTIRGQKIALIGINDFNSNFSYKKQLSIISDLKNHGYLVIVSMHWGSEYESIHNSRQQSIAHELVDAGTKLIIGHHPHVIQDVEYYKGIPIVYSLGNFIFSQNFEKTKLGNMLLFSIGKSSTNIELIPFSKDNNFKINF